MADANQSAGAEVIVPRVRTVKVEIKNSDYFIHSTGKIRPLFSQKIMSPLEGQIKICAKKDGDFANAGETLISFDTEVLNLKRERGEINLKKAKLEFESNLLGYNSGKKQIPDSIRQTLKASAGLTQAELDLKEIYQEVKKATIYAPYTCRIANLKVQKNWPVRNGDELLTIYSDNQLLVEVNVLETEVGKLKMNCTAEVRPLANQEKTYQAHLYEINPMVDENGMVKARLLITETLGLIPGMNVKVMIAIPEQKALMVPRESLVLRSGKTVVFTFEEGRAKWNYVKTGLEGEKDVEVVEGISVGQRVIVSNNILLSHDARVVEEP